MNQSYQTKTNSVRKNRRVEIAAYGPAASRHGRAVGHASSERARSGDDVGVIRPLLVAVGAARGNELRRRLGQNGDQTPRGAPSAVSRVTLELREGVVVLVTVLR